MRSHRQVAPGTEFGEEPPLGIDGPSGDRVLDPGKEVRRGGVVGSTLDGEGALGHLGQQDPRVERVDNRGGEAQAVEGGLGDDDRVEVGGLRETGGDVSAQRFEVQVGAPIGEVGSAADGTGGDPGRG